MQTQTIAIIALAFFVPLGYVVLLRYLARRAHPARMRMAELGHVLLGSDAMSERLKVIVNAMLDDAYDPNFMMYAAWNMPQALLWIKRRPADWLNDVKDQAVRHQLDEFLSCHMKATAAANPVFTVVVAIELAIAVMVLLPYGLLRRLPEALLTTAVRADKQLRHARS